MVSDAALGIMGVLGIPVAVWLFFHERKKERKQAEYDAFNALDNKYIDFLALCLQHPELGVSPVRLPKGQADSVPTRKRHLLYLVLISILERAFVMYSSQRSELRRRQWEGWVDFIRDLAKQPRFREAWHTHKDQFDAKFVAFMIKLDAQLSANDERAVLPDPVIEPSLEIRETSKGPGVFATTNLPAGTILTGLRGTIRPAATQKSLQLGRCLHVDSSGEIDDFLNHSCDANALFDFGRVSFVARREIRAGDEVCINYCATEYELHSPFTCKCGSKNCYGSVAGYRHLNREQRSSVDPYASPFLRDMAAGEASGPAANDVPAQ